jgi:hypothetical protein
MIMNKLPKNYDDRYEIVDVEFEGYYIVDTRGMKTKVTMNWHKIEFENGDIKAKLGAQYYKLIEHIFEGQTYFVSKESAPHIHHLADEDGDVLKGVTNEQFRVLEATADYHNIDLPTRKELTEKETPKEILDDDLNGKDNGSSNDTDDFRYN